MRIFVVADLAGDLPEAAPGEAGYALGDSDMDAVDGPQVEVGVQSPEDASGQVVAGLKRGACGLAWWCRSPGIALVIATVREAGGRGTGVSGATTALRCR